MHDGDGLEHCRTVIVTFGSFSGALIVPRIS
jgi:hypothetical protein